MLKYIGKAFIVGIPARDLTDEEAEKYGKFTLIQSGLYEEVFSAEKPRKKNLKETAKQADKDSAEVNDHAWN